MGKIYDGIIKRVGEELLAKYPDLFDGDFESNKDKVKSTLNTDSKKLINKVAGYITSKINALKKSSTSSDKESDVKQIGTS